MTLHLECADELLSTTRAVRKRLDLTRPVPREVILDCIRLSQQAPTATNSQNWRWIVVTDPAKRAALSEIYRKGARKLFETLDYQALAETDPQMKRNLETGQYHLEHFHEIPAHVIPCLAGGAPRPEAVRPAYASIYPAVWSFNLALRARGLGTVLTTLHLLFEDEAAELLNLPADYHQVALLPVAYTLGEKFHPAARPPPESITYFDGWSPREV